MRRNSARILAIVIAFLFIFTAYSAITRPEYVTYGIQSYQQGFFGSSSQISNRTMLLSAYNDNETLLFYSNGLFVPYFKSSQNSPLHGNYFLNLSGYEGHIVGAYSLTIDKIAENISQPGAGITFSVSDLSMVSSNPFVYIPLKINYLNTTNGHPQFDQPYLFVNNFDYPILSSFPVNQTLQFWVNFTITPVVELGPYYLPGSSTHVSITWNLTIINKP